MVASESRGPLLGRQDRAGCLNPCRPNGLIDMLGHRVVFCDIFDTRLRGFLVLLRSGQLTLRMRFSYRAKRSLSRLYSGLRRYSGRSFITR